MDALTLSQDPPTKVITLAVTQDTVCPWCYIGWKEMESAIHLAESNRLPLKFEVEFKPYRLDPTLPTQGIDKQQRYLSKFGPERWANIRKVLNKRGHDVDIDFNFNGPIRRTGDCHRVLRYAYQQQQQANNAWAIIDDDVSMEIAGRGDVQGRLANEIFKGFFERGEDIEDADNLARYCETVGLMTRDETIEFLESPALYDEVEDLIDEAQSEGITGVPHTVINSRWAIVGGQPADVFYQIFEKLAQA